MGYWPDVNPGETFQPNAKLENEIRHRLNALNGFGGGAIQAGNPGLIRVPVYNATSAVLQAGKAVSIDLTGTIAGDAYPAIAFSDSLPCYGVLLKDLNAGDCGTCVLSGLASVQIASTPATGNYALPGTGGVFVRGDEGTPILNVSGTSAVVMLGAVTATGGKEYKEGSGITITPGIGGEKDTISANITGSGVIDVSGGSNGNPLVVSFTGSSSSEFYVPDYSDLTVGGLAQDSFGRAISFIVPVKAGNINYWDEGGGAVGVYVDITGTTVQVLTNKTNYLAPADGWMRISVYDDGSAPGECLSFASPTGGIPLYKYSYNVSGITASISGSTAFVGLIGGNTNSTIAIKGSGAVSISGSSNSITISANTGATGITSSISEYGTVTISLNGGSGSIVLIPGTGVSITQNYTNTYTISCSGSGSFSIPDWQNNQGSDTPGGTITHLAWISGNTISAGYLKDHNTFSPSSDGFIYCFAELQGNSDYQAVHVNVNGALFKVVSLYAPNGGKVGSSIIIPVRSGKNISIHSVSLSSALVGCVFYSI